MAVNKPVPIDSETLPIAPAYGAPKLVCVQYDAGDGPVLVTRRRGALEHIRVLLEGPRLLVLHMAAFDCGVWAAEGMLDLVVAKLKRCEIHCTWVYERLGEITGASTRKKLDLNTCLKAHGLPPHEAKDKQLAVTFAQFIEAESVPEPWLSYALGDLAVLRLYQRQAARFKDVPTSALARLTYRQFWLQLRSVWGLTTSADAVDALDADARQALDDLKPLAREWGFVRPDGTRNMAEIRAAVEAAYGASTPRTPTGLAQTGEVVLDEANDPRLSAFSEFGSWTKTLTNDVPNLRASGTGWISTRYGMCETLRTTSSGDKKGQRTGLIAMQNLRQAAGVRECIRPRPGMAFYNVDASGLELCTLAQLCVSRLGRRGMAETIKAAGTPGAIHTRVGAMLAKESVATFTARLQAKDELAIAQRTRAKNGVFGYMGGMGPKTYVDYIAKLSKGKVKLTLGEATEIREAIFSAMPDIQAWLKHVGTTGDGDTFDVPLEYGVVRRGAWYSAAANNPFQSKAAAAMTEVIIAVAEACYLGVLSPARPCLFVHDEDLIEVPVDAIDDFERAFLRIAAEAVAPIMPDVPVIWEAEACDRYSKKAKRIVTNGRLQVWTP